MPCHFIDDRPSLCLVMSVPGSSAGKESACNAGGPGLIPGSGRSPGEGNCYPLQYSGLESSMDCIVHGFTKSRTPLSDFHFHNKQGARCFKIWILVLVQSLTWSVTADHYLNTLGLIIN